ncbi:MAG: hypothetical protein M3Y27_25575, partial [Acidobacteriota bacterium]|nr:hypothetical protein [Acidobacteriota bacterium]
MSAQGLVNYFVAGAAGVALIGALSIVSPTRADDRGRDRDNDEARSRRGFEIAPVPLNLRGKDRDLVGLGSYIVNAVASCNDCHSADPSVQYAPGGNPYFKGSPPKVVNQATYLA